VFLPVEMLNKIAIACATYIEVIEKLS
jgi:hypothetical protein